MRRPPVSKKRIPVQHEEVEALAELTHCEPLLSDCVVEALGDQINANGELPIDHPHPERLFPGNEVPFVRNPMLRKKALCVDGVVHLRPQADPRHEGWLCAHELGEAVLRVSRWLHRHVDVQRLACAILVPASIAVPLLDRMGFYGALHCLTRRHRFCPAWVIEWRLYTLATARGRETPALALP